MTRCFPPVCRGLGLTPEEQMALVPGAQFGSPSTSPGVWDWIAQMASGWSKTGQDILRQQNIARGVYTQTGPGGVQTTYVQPEGTSQNIFGATGGQFGAQASPGFGLVLIGGAALVLVFMLAKR